MNVSTTTAAYYFTARPVRTLAILAWATVAVASACRAAEPTAPTTTPSATPATAPASRPADGPVQLKATDGEGLRANLKKRAEVTGTVFRASLSKSGKVFRIEFKGAKESGFQVVIFERNLRAFKAQLGEELDNALTGKTISVVGTLEDYQGKPEIALSDPTQLKIQ